MKKRILNLGFVCLGILLFAACQKQNLDTQSVAEPKEEIGETKSIQGKPEPHPSINACYHPRWRFCWELAKCNCTVLKDIIVKPQFTDDIRTASGNSNPLVVANIFNNTNYADVFYLIPDDQLDSLRSGHYYLSIENEDSTKMCVFTGPTIPLTESNVAYVLQFDK